MTDLDQALTTEELDALGDFLAQPELENRSMDLSMLEGYLTAIVIGPRVVMPSQWLPWVWDADEGREEAMFADLDQANQILHWVMRFQNSIVLAFMGDPASFEPMFWREARWGAAEWCEGFLLGTQFHREAWTGLWLLQPTWLTPFLRLGTDEGMRLIVKERNAETWMEAVAPTLVKVRAYWIAHRQHPPEGLAEEDFGFGQPRLPGARKAPKIGRNEPCPCGSGKKLKKCCGAALDITPPESTNPH